MEVRRQGNRLGFSSMELQQEKTEQARVLRSTNLNLLGSNGVLDHRLRNGVRMGCKFFSYAERYPKLGELGFQEFETADRGQIRDG